MKISYKKLWKLLIDRDMMKKDLAEKAGISNASIAKLILIIKSSNIFILNYMEKFIFL